ncbi:MAG TPA: hypothetical protein VGE16_09605 [Albitalea sp.]
MKIIDIRHRDAFDLAVGEVHLHPIIVQLPTVFVLLAAPTSAGAQQLNDAKMRLAGKNYGTAIGSMERFLHQTDPSRLPEEFSTAAQFARMAGSFIRVQFRSPDFRSACIRDGTHQGLLLDGIHRALFERIEASFLWTPPDPLWGGHNYSAPLCTSCNVSGDPEGSIVRLDKALAFGRARGVRLTITCPDTASQLGSYPIFGYQKHGVTVHREGPYLPQFQARIPQHLQAWSR